MAETQIRHVYDCDEDTFWREILFDAEFNRRLYVEHLGFEQWDVLRDEDDERERRREIRVHPVTGELPAALAKVVGDNIGYTEKGVFDKRRRRYTADVIPNRMPDKLRIRAELYVEPRGDSRCERFVDLRVEAKIFGIGGLIERRILSDTIDGYDRGYAFGQRYLAERGP
jgi:Protein of unknown function (DUF2505)